jgi:uncharacterized protein
VKRRTLVVAGSFGGLLLAGTAIFRGFQREDTLPSSLSGRSGPLALPSGFSCIEIDRAGGLLTDGSRSPDLPDGMACFEGPSGEWILMRNHELGRNISQGAYPAGQPEKAYRSDVHGGVSRLVLNPQTLRVTSSNMVLTGTMLNCAGGPSPWGWLSCEESTEDHHGYVFLCPADAQHLKAPRKVPAYGRFRHEAVAIDPDTHAAYLTEDDPDGCLYRLMPRDPQEPFRGQLEALRIKERPEYHTGDGLKESAEVEWVPIREVAGKKSPLRIQAEKLGSAKFRRSEGIWWAGDGVVFTASTGGAEGLGQIFHLGTDNRLNLVVESTHEEQLKGPDNITLSPWGDFIVAEDTGGPTYLRGVTRTGSIYPIARNMMSQSEFAGVCFSPDGKVLFVNLQHDGLTVAIRGPWETLRQNPGAKSDT